MSARNDLLNKQYGSLLIIRYSHTQNTHAMWYAICDVCLKTSIVDASNIASNNTQGCNHCRIAGLKAGITTHGLCNSRLYGRWETLKDKNVLCKEWFDFETFYINTFDTFEEGFSLRRIDKHIPHSFQNSYWYVPKKLQRNGYRRVNFK